MQQTQSQKLYARACAVLPGGVNSPVRAFCGVGGNPIFFKQGIGPYLLDVDNKQYIDYVGSWGPLILGHCHPKVIAAVEQTLRLGMTFGATTEVEIQLAEKICKLMPSVEKIRLVNSGTEATMTAVRLARAYTQRDKIIKFIGCYHGHNDSLLVQAGSGALTLGVPSTPGIPTALSQQTLVAAYNDLSAVKLLFEQYGEDIAAIIVEPVAANMGLVLPTLDFLLGLRALCDTYHSILIFDEVLTGFRVALGGAQAIYGVLPDLTTLGKIIGGGMPVGAVGGKLEIMSYLAPEGPVYQAGTLSGNPLAMAAGLATLCELEQPDFYKSLSEHTMQLIMLLKQCCLLLDIPFYGAYLGGLFGFSFNSLHNICNYDAVRAGDLQRFKAFFHGMLAQGIYFAPSMYEAGFVSSQHNSETLAATQSAAELVLQTI